MLLFHLHTHKHTRTHPGMHVYDNTKIHAGTHAHTLACICKITHTDTHRHTPSQAISLCVENEAQINHRGIHHADTTETFHKAITVPTIMLLLLLL